MSDATATLAELEAEFKDKGTKIGLLSARRKVLVGLIEERKRLAAARVKVKAMDELEKEALKSVLSEP